MAGVMLTQIKLRSLHAKTEDDMLHECHGIGPKKYEHSGFASFFNREARGKQLAEACYNWLHAPEW